MSDAEILTQAVQLIRDGKELKDIQEFISKSKPELIPIEVDLFAASIYDDISLYGG